MNELEMILKEEINEMAEGLEYEELKELCEEMENRWFYRRINYRSIEEVIENFKEEHYLN